LTVTIYFEPQMFWKPPSAVSSTMDNHKWPDINNFYSVTGGGHVQQPGAGQEPEWRQKFRGRRFRFLTSAQFREISQRLFIFSLLF